MPKIEAIHHEGLSSQKPDWPPKPKSQILKRTILFCFRYWSDFKDAFASQTIASIIYIYLATITKAITFGGFLGDITDGLQGVLEAFLGHALAGGFFCLFGGQPLTVLGCTGPVLIFEKILVDCCKEYELDYMTFRQENKTHQCTIFDTKASFELF